MQDIGSRHFEFRFLAITWASINILHQIWYHDGKSAAQGHLGQKSDFRNLRWRTAAILKFEKLS